jgi:Yip1 domain
MTTPLTASATAPAPKSLVARFIGVLTAPRDTFASVAAHPKWFGMLAVTALLGAIFTALPLTTPEGKQAALEQQVQQRASFGVTTDEAAYAQMEKMQNVMPYITAGSVLVFSPIMALIFAGILFAIFNAAMGGEASFKQLFSVFLHAGAVSTLSAVLSGAVNYFRGAVGSVTNMGALLPMLPEKSFIANLLSTVDLFLVWYVVVLAIGLAVLYRRRTQPIAISLLSVYAVIAIAIALFKSRGGGA